MSEYQFNFMMLGIVLALILSVILSIIFAIKYYKKAKAYFANQKFLTNEKNKIKALVRGYRRRHGLIHLATSHGIVCVPMIFVILTITLPYYLNGASITTIVLIVISVIYCFSQTEFITNKITKFIIKKSHSIIQK